MAMKSSSRDCEEEFGSGSEGLGDFVKAEESSDIASIDHLSKPPPERDLEFFRKAGLSVDGDNPHRLKEHKHVPTAEIEKVFGKWSSRAGYRYKNCRDPLLREKIERIWKLAYSKDAMPRSKIVSTQFGLGIVAEEMGRPISWAEFAEETNASQRLKYQKRVDKAVATLKDAKKLAGSTRSVKLEGESECDLNSKLTGPGTVDVRGGAQHCGRSKEWILQLTAEITQLLQLCAMEVEAVKQQLHKARKEKEELQSRVSAHKILLESVQASLSEEVCKTQALEKRAASHFRSPSASPCKPQAQAGNVVEVGPEPFDTDSLSEQKMQETCLRRFCEKHAGQYSQLCGELEQKEKVVQDLEHRSVYCDLQNNALGEQLLSLKKRQGGIRLYPHPLVYPAESQEPRADFLKITTCVLCKCSFPHSDIIVTSCRHLYHPWCAAIHFRHHSTCIDGTCGARLSPEWCLSFGFREFDQEMNEQALAEGCEEARLQLLNLRSQTARVHCPNVGMCFLISNVFICTVVQYVFVCVKPRTLFVAFLGCLKKPISLFSTLRLVLFVYL